MEDCIFCKIIEGKIPSAKLYEDRDTIAFLDIAPINKGHALVVPKKHSVNLLDINEADATAAMKTLRKIAKAVSKANSNCAINLEMNNGREAGQIVFHSHMHVIPRFENDGHDWKRTHTKYEGNEMHLLAEKIKQLI